MPLNGQPDTGPGDFILDIPALEPEREEIKVAGTVIEVRDNDEVSLRQMAKLIRMLRTVRLENITHIYNLDDEEFDAVFEALDLIFNVGFVTDGEPGIPDEVLGQVRELDQITIAMVFVNRFFGRTQATQIIQEDEAQTLEGELDQIAKSIGDVKSHDSATGSAEA